MKKIVMNIVLILCCNFIYAQNTIETGVEKNITGIQIGLFGLEVYNEHKISDKFVLRSELSLIGGITTATNMKRGYVFYPAINIQPKYYYNIKKRAKKGKNIKNNSANYFSLQTTFTSSLFVISNLENIHVPNHLTLIPTFGIRRTFSKNFNYEFKVGYGYLIRLDKPFGNGTAFDLSFKIGYDF